MIVNGQENKLAEVLVHVLGVKKYINSFGKLGLEGLQLWTQKTGDQNSRVWGRIASPRTARVSKLLFLMRVCVELFKMSGGSAYLRVDGRKLQGVSQKGQDLLAGLYIYIYIYAYISMATY